MDESNRIRPARFDKAVVTIGDTAAQFKVVNPFGRQQAKVRIEALLVPSRYDDPSGITMAGPEENGMSIARAAEGVSGDFANVETPEMPFSQALRYTAGNVSGSRTGSWCELRRAFDETISLVGKTGLGLWVNGDGKGEVLNVQFVSPTHISHGIADHYIPIDFVGWRYFMLVEPEGERFAQFTWPYGNPYAIYREYPDVKTISMLSLWYNNLPVHDSVECLISPVRALPLCETPVRNPVLSVKGSTVSFDATIPTGGYLESDEAGNAIVYGPDGDEICRAGSVEDEFLVDSGAHEVSISADSGETARARVTVGFSGDPIS